VSALLDDSAPVTVITSSRRLRSYASKGKG
jgi:hypothetical protein